MKTDQSATHIENSAIFADVIKNIDSGVIILDLQEELVVFLNDPALFQDTINETCERCPLTREQCTVRGAEPTYLQEQEAEREREQAMRDLAAQLRV